MPITYADKDNTAPSGTPEKRVRDIDLNEIKNEHNALEASVSNVDNTSDASKPVSTAQAAAIAVVQSDINAHAALTNNPHGVTKTQVGLSNVDNTSDTNKPVSTAQQTALDLKLTITNIKANIVPLGAINGSNLNYTLPDTPSVFLFLVVDNSVLTPTVDYTRSGANITIVGFAPVSQVLAFYII